MDSRTIRPTSDEPIGNAASSVKPAAAQPTSEPAPAVGRPKRRRRLWAILLGCLLVLAAIVVGGYYWLAWLGDRELEVAIAELDQADPHWRFEDLMAERLPIPDEQNPALVVMKIDRLLLPGNYDVGQKNLRLFEEMASVHQLNGMQITALRDSFTRHTEALKLARTLKDFPGEGNFNIKVSPDWLSTNLEPLQRCRGVMYMLSNDAMLRAEDEDAAGAMESCRALLVAARSIGNEPYLIAALVRYAGHAITVDALERTLAQTEPPLAQLEAMQRLLALEIEAPIFVEAIRGERAGVDRMMLTVHQGKVKVSTIMGSSGNSWETWIVDHVPLVVSGGRPEYLRLMNKNVEAAKLPAEQQQPGFDEVEKEAKKSSAIFVRMLLPAMTKVGLAHRRSQANMRSSMVGVAAECYRIKHNQWPATLDDLCKEGLLQAVPTDPFDGQPLRYTVRPDGVIIYSVGVDGTDNGGAIDRANPTGPGVDLGFRLWDVPARRQPPLPPPPPED
jgi:hypothetical protein